jgi:multisubunit Na+/H+ antiporter MnhE subunit
MTAVLLRAAGLAAVYLLVLASVDPGDIAIGAALGLAVAIALRPADAPRGRMTTLAGPRAVAAVLGRTAAEIVVGTWRTVRFCLGGRAAPGFVEVPRGDRTDGDIAMWGLLTGEAPDEYPVHVDEKAGVLVVHVLDASDPEAVRARHRRTAERWRGRG